MDDLLGELEVQIKAALGPLERDLAGVRRDLDRFGERAEREVSGRATGAFRNLGAAAVAAGAAVAAIGTGIALSGALSQVASFETSIRRVGAVTGATGRELEQLEDTARQLGATTTFSAQEAASG
ncbi:MAG: hypothetical protein AAFQ81_09320, partial [Pseudomonadota bacterium]